MKNEFYIVKVLFTLLLIGYLSKEITAQNRLISRYVPDYPKGTVTSGCTPDDTCTTFILPDALYNTDYKVVIPMQVTPPFSCSIDGISASNDAIDGSYTLNNNLDTIKLKVTQWDAAGDEGFITFNFHAEKTGFTPENQLYTIRLRRDTAKIVLVIDKSGSMGTRIGSTNRTRMDTLKNAVSRLMVKIEKIHQAGDSIGLTYFSTHVLQPNSTNFPQNFIEITPDTSPVLSSDKIKNDLTAIYPSGMTAMGKGLLDAKAKLLKDKENSPNTKRMVFLITDGLQNQPPVVCNEGIGLSNGYSFNHISPQIYNAVCTGSVIDYLNDYSENPKDSIRYYTLATWEAGLYPEVLNAIAQSSGGEALHVIPDSDINAWIVMNMVNMFHGGSPQLVFEKSADDLNGDITYSFELNDLVKTLLIDLSAKNIDISIKKGETNMMPYAQINSDFNIYSFNFPVESINSKGKWEIKLSGSTSKPYFLSVLVDDHYLNYNCSLNKNTYTVGETIELHAKLSHLGKPLTGGENKVIAYILKPSDDIGHLLSIYETSFCDTSDEDIGDGVSQKFNQLFSNNTDFYNALLPNTQKIELTNLGNGEFAGSFNNTDLSGLYNVIFTINGSIPDFGNFDREKRMSSLIVNDGSSSSINTFVDNQAPPVPENIRADNLTETSFKLKWDPVYDNFGIDKYLIFKNGILFNEVNFNKCMLNISKLAPATEYSFYVTAIDASGLESNTSESISITTLGAPDTQIPSAPGNLLASNIGPTTLNLSWDEANDNYEVVEYYVYKNDEIYSRTSSSSIQLESLQAETNYNFYIAASDASGNLSNPSNSINITTKEEPDHEKPSVPSNLTALEVTQESIYLTWNSSTDNKSVSGYDIYENEVYLFTSDNNEFYRNNLAPETNYWYYLFAKDEAGNISDQSTVLQITTLGIIDTIKPTPVNLSATNIAHNSLLLNWTESQDNVDVIQYIIYKNNEFLKSTIETQFSVTGLIEGSNYNFYVTAKDAAQNTSEYSNILQVTTSGENDPIAPSNPSNLSASHLGKSCVYLKWNASSDNKAVDKYIVYMNGDSLTSTPNTSKFIYSLSSSTNYQFYIVAMDLAKNKSESSNPIKIKTLEKSDILNPPNRINASKITQTSFKLNWNSSEGTQQNILYGIFINGVFIDKTSQLFYDFNNLDPSTNYQINLIASDRYGNMSDASKTIDVKTLDKVLFPKDFFNTVGVRIRPKGKFGYYLGPGYKEAIHFEYKAKRKELITHKASIIAEANHNKACYPKPYLKNIKDNLDGSYDIIVGNIKPKTNPEIKITIRGETLYDGHLYRIPFWFYVIIIITIVIILILRLVKLHKTKLYQFIWLILIVLLIIWFLHYTGLMFFLYMI